MSFTNVLNNIDSDLFSEKSGFLLKYAPLAKSPATFVLYDEVLGQVPQWYGCKPGVLRVEFDRAFVNPPENWINAIEHMDTRELDKLFSSVTILSHLYRWGYLPANEVEYQRVSITLPNGLRYPLIKLSEVLSRPPCGSLWSTTVSNYTVAEIRPGDDLSARELSKSNISALYNWFKGRDVESDLDSWVRVFVLYEAKASELFPIISHIIDNTERKKLDALAENMASVNEILKDLGRIFSAHTHDKVVNVATWRTTIQPTFVWGVCTDGVRHEGASGLQLAVMQLIDFILTPNDASKMGQAAKASRAYMPLHIRNILVSADSLLLNFRNLVSDSPHTELRHEYEKAVASLARFRRAHMQIGHKYLKGDGKKLNIVSTGLSIDSGDDPEKVFVSDMTERISETELPLVKNRYKNTVV